LLNIRDPSVVLGLRPGEALGCIHASEGPGGCGTGQACPSCGAAIAIVACLQSGQTEQRDCVATVERNRQLADMYFQVRCSPFDFRGERLLLLFLRDATIDQQRMALERTFFHDINNLISALLMSSELLEESTDGADRPYLAQRIIQVSTQLAKEVEIQRSLSLTHSSTYEPQFQTISLARSLLELQAVLGQHPAAVGKEIQWPALETEVQLVTDPILLHKVLCNMLLNALEAANGGQPIKFGISRSATTATFSVWNDQVIAPHIVPRIFQRNFSTKAGAGRGLGTYSMRLFGETYLGGQVRFTTGPDQGTVFSLALPLPPAQPAEREAALGSEPGYHTVLEQVQARG
jgi:signal transduction histidine kinase